MKKHLIALLLLAATALTLSAASLDGMWSAQVTTKPKKAAADWKAPEFDLNLKTEGDKLTGTVSAANAKRAQQAQIQDGKVTGDSFTFVTMQKTKDGESKIVWSGTLKGEEMTGTRGKEGAKKTPSFVAKRK